MAKIKKHFKLGEKWWMTSEWNEKCTIKKTKTKIKMFKDEIEQQKSSLRCLCSNCSIWTESEMGHSKRLVECAVMKTTMIVTNTSRNDCKEEANDGDGRRIAADVWIWTHLAKVEQTHLTTRKEQVELPDCDDGRSLARRRTAEMGSRSKKVKHHSFHSLKLRSVALLSTPWSSLCTVMAQHAKHAERKRWQRQCWVTSNRLSLHPFRGNYIFALGSTNDVASSSAWRNVRSADGVILQSNSKYCKKKIQN